MYPLIFCSEKNQIYNTLKINAFLNGHIYHTFYFKQIKFIYLPIVKSRNIIFRVISVLLVVFLIIGSTGITIVVQSCNSMGITVNTQLFESLTSPTNDSCCLHADTEETHNISASLESGCCTFTTEKLKLGNYTHPVKISITTLSIVKALNLIALSPEVTPLQTLPLFVHNKHGGEKVIISNCQLLI